MRAAAPLRFDLRLALEVMPLSLYVRVGDERVTRMADGAAITITEAD